MQNASSADLGPALHVHTLPIVSGDGKPDLLSQTFSDLQEKKPDLSTSLVFV